MLSIMPTAIEKLARTDAGLASALRVSVARLTRRLRTERDPDSDQLSPGQFAVLGLLDRLGECPVGELAAQERVQPPSMTRTVNCLEEGGYVTRRPHERDRRQVVVRLADRGKAAIEAERRRRDAWLAVRLRELSPQERAVLRQAAPILEKLAKA
jgi:DNA-binding MarR family transcriptional regulator